MVQKVYFVISSLNVIQLHCRRSCLNQWADWTRAQGPGFFSFLRGPQLAVVK